MITDTLAGGADSSSAPLAAPPRLATRGVRKEFPGLVALDDINLEVRAGEIHAIVGQNGAGKSTLVKVLTGIYHADAGDILIDGEPVEIRTAQQARAQGIAIVHQDQPAVPKLTVARNAFLGRELRTRFRTLDSREMNRRTAGALAVIQADFSATTLMEELTVAQRMQAAIAAAFMDQPRVLILDEPTASLGAPEAQRLFAAIRSVNDAGVTVIYISHRLGEIAELASVATVLRDGQLVGRLDLAAAGRGELIRRMIGRELSALYPKETVPLGGPLLEVANLTVNGAVEGVDLTVRRGEIVGLAGLVGSGASQIASAIFGAVRSSHSSMRLEGTAVRIRSPRAAAKARLALIPPDRRTEGIFAGMSVGRNLGVAAIGKLSTWGWMNQAAERRNAESLIDRLSIATRGPDQDAGTLSGGNQQKVVIGKWLARGASLYLLDEPTAGVDVGSKVEVYRQMSEVVKAGSGIVIVSSDFEEMVAMCDRILVIVDGRVAHEARHGEVDLEQLTALAAGGSASPDASPTAGDEAAAASPDGPTTRRPGGRDRNRWLAPSIAVVAMIALLVWLGIGAPAFFRTDSLMTVARQGSVAALLACALSLALAVGGFDLSVGGVAQVSANLVSTIVIGGSGVVAGMSLGIGVGLAIGAFNAALIYFLRMPSFVATLGTLFLLMGLSLQINGGLRLNVDQDRTDFLMIGQGYLGVIPVVTMIVLVAVAVLHLWLRHTATGGRIYASGSNPSAAILSGVSPRRYTVISFTAVGVISGFAGVLSASYSSGVSASDQTMTLLVSAASASFLGLALSPTREFNVLGAAISAIFVIAVSNGLIMNGISNMILPGIQGAVLLGAVVLSSFRRRQLGQVAIF